MTALSIAIVDKVVVAINSSAINAGENYTAVRSFAEWSDVLEDFGVLHVDVVPVFNPATELETRGTVSYKQAVDIAIRKRLGPEHRNELGRLDVTKLDSLVEFVEAVHDYFVTDRFTNTEIIWLSSEIRALFTRDQLRENHQFLGVVRLTFEAVKTL
jgi:hypothetical protein